MNDREIFAFILMPFDHQYDDIYNIGIKEAAAQLGIVAERLDEQIFMEGMLDRIYRQIEAADIIIAELSEKNANVYYELGYAHAKDKICILQTKDATDIPFDLRHRRHIVYNGSIKLLREELIKNLEWAKQEVENIRKSQIRVVFRQPSGVGALRLTKFQAFATLDFLFDLFNDSNKPSPEISAIYFYTGTSWTIKQDEKECPYTESDISKFKYRYFLNPPVSRLGRNSWARLMFKSERILASKFRGEELKDEYTLSGYSILRFATSEGIFDYGIYIDAVVTEIPF